MNKTWISASTPIVARDWSIPEDHPRCQDLLESRVSACSKLAQWQQRIDLIGSLIRPNVGPNAHILDVASGGGLFALELANQGFALTTLEMNCELCEVTNLSSASLDLDVSAVQGDACALPFDDDSFDAVMSKSFFEHVYDVDLALVEQVRVLRPDGLLIIRDGNLLNPKLLFNLLVLYPIRSKGKYGGLNWLLTKGRVRRDLYGFLPLGRDEDAKTVWWWRRRIAREKSLSILEITTTGKYTHPHLPGMLRLAVGSCLVAARKIPTGSPQQ